MEKELKIIEVPASGKPDWCEGTQPLMLNLLKIIQIYEK